jgi:hypothetical protein
MTATFHSNVEGVAVAAVVGGGGGVEGFNILRKLSLLFIVLKY